MARITVTINRHLIEVAKKLSGKKTIRETIESALTEFVKRESRKKVASHAGKFELTFTQEKLRRMREER
jgi:hypothetical protein